MNSTEVIIGVICNNESICQMISTALEKQGASTYHYRTFKELIENRSVARFHGFVVEMKTILKSSAEEKSIFNDLDSYFPLMRINTANGKISATMSHGSFEGEEAFVKFVDLECKPAPAKGLRLHPRQKSFVPVYWTAAEVPESNWRKGTTYNLSKNGMFLIDNEVQLEIGTTIKVRIPLRESPVESKIRWQLSWGKTSQHPPGYGLETSEIIDGI